jgi:hypothetical protein
MHSMNPQPAQRRLPWLHAVAAAIFLQVTASFAAPASESINGRVLDANGRPAIAQVAIFNNGRLEQVWCGHADGCFERLIATGAARVVGTSEADGRFALRIPGGLRPDDTVWAEGKDASGQGIRTSWPVLPNRALPTSTLGDIQLNQRLDFFVVVKVEGQPVAGAEVDFGNNERLRTDASGTASRHMQVPPLSPDTGGWHIAFTVRAEGFAAEEWASYGGVPAGATTHVVELVPETIQTGRVLDPDRQPIAHAALTAVAAEAVPGVMIHTSGSRAPDRTVGSARTGATGMFALHGLRAGKPYRLTISTDHSGVSNAVRTITAAGESIDIVMGAAAPLTIALSGLDAIRGRLESDLTVLGPEADRPLIGLESLDPATGAWSPVSSPHLIRSLAATDAEVVFSQVPVGTIRIVTNNVFGIAGDVSMPLEHGGSRTVAPLKLVGTRPLRLQVVDEAGRPVAGARVEFSSHTGRDGASATTQADGVVAFQVHSAHDVKLTVTLSGQVILTANVRGSVTEPQLLVVPTKDISP